MSQPYSTTGPLLRTKYQNPDTGERTAEIRANLYIEGDLDVRGEITQNGEPLGSDGAALPYTTYVALLTQSGTDAPVATVLENTLGGTVVWTYAGLPGRYNATLSGAFPVGKTLILLTTNALITPTSVGYVHGSSADSIQLRVFDESLEGADDRLTRASIEIRVYP